MPQFRAVVGRQRSLFNGVTDAKLAPRFFFALFAARLAAMTQSTCNATLAMRQFTNLKVSCVDGAVDCGMAHLIGTVFQFCPVRYLLG